MTAVAPVEGVEVRLDDVVDRAECRLAVQLVDAAGKPVSEPARVTLATEAGRTLVARSTGGGLYTFDDLMPGSYEICAEVEGWASARASGIPAQRADAVVPVKLVVGDRSGAELRGTIEFCVGAAKRPLEVRLLDQDRVMGVGRSTRDGDFAIEGLAAGTYAIDIADDQPAEFPVLLDRAMRVDVGPQGAAPLAIRVVPGRFMDFALEQDAGASLGRRRPDVRELVSFVVKDSEGEVVRTRRFAVGEQDSKVRIALPNGWCGLEVFRNGASVLRYHGTLPQVTRIPLPAAAGK
jgi:hypothetical protein